jgi:hypothetical protein
VNIYSKLFSSLIDELEIDLEVWSFLRSSDLSVYNSVYNSSIVADTFIRESTLTILLVVL